MNKWLRSLLGYCLIAAIVFGLCAALYAGFYAAYLRPSIYTATSDASQFNTNRQPLADEQPAGGYLPLQVGDFRLQSETIWRDEGSYYRGTYRAYDGEIRLLVVRLTGSSREFVTSTLYCAECANAPQYHLDAPISYAYGYCGCFGFSQHTFNWINGDWGFQAQSSSSSGIDGNTLLEFVNNYPY